MPKQEKKQKKSTDTSDDWLRSLVEVATKDADRNSKEERIQKRAAKKRRRDERKGAAASRQHHLSESTPRIERPSAEKRLASRRILSFMAEEMKSYVETYVEEHSKKRDRLYRPADASESKARTKRRSLDDTIIQPRRNDYSGIGLARPSLFLSLDDPAFVPKLEEEFAEHVAGFFGKQRTKAMKKQEASKMLWRKLADKKKNGDETLGGKKLAAMSPDERVEAMIKAGML